MILWLENNPWGNFTREERQFCADLYCLLRSDQENLTKLVGLINDKATQRNGSAAEPFINKLKGGDRWEIGVEVAFFRDYSHFFQIKDDKFGSKHRKFDMALFSNDQFIIIEAKAQGRFKKEDLSTLQKNKELLKNKFKDVQIHSVLLCSSIWKHRGDWIYSYCDSKITWDQLSQLFKNTPFCQSFKRADDVYNS